MGPAFPVLVARHRPARIGLSHGDHDLVQDVEADEREAGHQGAGKQVAHRHGLGREDTLLQLRCLVGGEMTSPSSTSTMEGGMIWPSVPAAQIEPVASVGS